MVEFQTKEWFLKYMWGKWFLNEDGVDDEDVGIGVVKTLEKGEELV